jgi:hypothetical protein
VHGTHEAIVKDVVGYNTHGHGFFLEDGFETNNILEHNLGIMIKPGIILPSDRNAETCETSFDGFPRTDVVDGRICQGLRYGLNSPY